MSRGRGVSGRVTDGPEVKPGERRSEKAIPFHRRSLYAKKDFKDLSRLTQWERSRVMDKPLPNPAQPYRNLIAGYTEAIRASDFKANIAFLFVAFMMGSVLWNYTSFPDYLSIQLVLLPFLVVYFFLFLVLIPRYPKRGAKSLPRRAQSHARGFRNRRPDCRRRRPVEADLRGAVRHSLVEDAIDPRRLPRVDRLRVPDLRFAHIRLLRMTAERAPGAGWRL